MLSMNIVSTDDKRLKVHGNSNNQSINIPCLELSNPVVVKYRRFMIRRETHYYDRSVIRRFIGE